MKKIIKILTLGLLLFFAGCASNQVDNASQNSIFGGGGGKTQTSPNSGVVLTFVEGNPPSELFKGQPVTFAFVFENYQEHKIEDLELKVSGFDTGFVSGLSEFYEIPSIPKASQAIGKGTYSGLNVNGVTVDGFEGSFNFNPVFDYCYTAKSKLVETVCVPSKSNQCKTEYKPESKKNGPLQINVEKINAIGDNVQVSFSLTNSGNGKVVEECFNTYEYATPYNINSIKLGTVEGQCSPTGTDNFLVAQGRGNFFCEFPRTGEDSYSTQITAEIEYLYQQQVKKSYKVIDPRV